MQFKTFAAAAALFTLVGGAAHAAVENFGTVLTGSNEVPANTTKGWGMVKGTLDTNTKVFNYTVTYKDITGPATAAHFHGPAGPGVNAPPSVAMKDLASPIKGTATLTDAQIADLEAGKWYFNVHTNDHKPGEIRGQVARLP